MRRIAVFADVQNLYYTVRQAHGCHFNYAALWADISQRGQIVEAYAYAIDRGDSKQQQFQQILRNLGFTVKLKPYIQRSDGSAKGDWDVGITIDIMDVAPNVDEVVLAVQSLIADGVDAVFTPTDNTIMKAELSICELLSDAGIPHYTGADSFALNGAFLGYGVDYANLGVETANMVAEVALEGKKPAELPVRTFDNGCATVNTETCEKLGYKFDDIEKTFAPFCTKVQSIVTAESFDELN